MGKLIMRLLVVAGLSRAIGAMALAGNPHSGGDRTAKPIVFGYNGDAGEFCVGTRIGIQPERGFRLRLGESYQPGWHLVWQFARRGPIRRCVLPTNCQSRSRTRQTLDYT